MTPNGTISLLPSLMAIFVPLSAAALADELRASDVSAAPSPNGAALDAVRGDREPLPIRGLGYRLTFEDRFASSSSIAKFGDYSGAKWYNGVEQCCMDDSTGLTAVNFPTKVNDRSVDPYSFSPQHGLSITLSKVDNVWYSGVLTSVDRFGKGFSQQYGYFEIRAKLPRGRGTWPAFWMKSLTFLTTGENIGEIDIFEQYGNNDYGFCTTYHDWSRKTTPYYNCGNATPDLTADFHTWGFLWTEKMTSVYFDDRKINETTTDPVMKQPYYLIMDMGLGGGWPTEETPNTNTMQVEYVRAYAPAKSERP